MKKIKVIARKHIRTSLLPSVPSILTYIMAIDYFNLSDVFVAVGVTLYIVILLLNIGVYFNQEEVDIFKDKDK